MAKLSIILLNYRSRQLLSSCLDSFYKLGVDIPFELIVVNNDDDKLTDFSLRYPNLKIIEINKNVGFSAGNNAGAKEAGGEIFAFINPDVLFPKNFDFTELLQLFEDEQVGIVGPGLLDKDSQKQDWQAGVEVTLFDTLKNNFGHIPSKKVWKSDQKTNADWISGAFLMIRKNLFDKLDSFDENLFMYFEDVDLCLRARKEGYKVVLYPEQKVVHFGGQSKESDKIQKEYFYKSQDYYFQKNRPFFEYLILRLFRRFFA